MNDLTFGTTLLALFATLIVAAIVETTSGTANAGASAAVARENPAAVQVAKASAEDCATVVLAPIASP